MSSASRFRFTDGDRVRVRVAYPRGHCRAPFYLRGHLGTIEARIGVFPDPEDLAYLEPEPKKRPLYHVRFEPADLFPEAAGKRADVVVADIYEHWLEEADG